MVIMVRTRGLGRALARVIGRGRQDEHDVPRRRRPTASTRRQRVHIAVDEGVPQMTEDVPHMADDFPQMSEDAPQMTAGVDVTIVEDLGRDGAEGSHADEGFPGGPRDPSVLTSFVEHVAHAIWTGHERSELKLVSHGRKVTLIGRPVPEIEGLVATTGLSPLIGCSVVAGDPGLISIFVERWHRETNTFHLPVGELKIALDDVSSLFHLPISGAFHSFEALSVDEAVFLLMELLEVSGEEARAEIVRARGAYVCLSWVREIYEMRCQTRRWIVAARAYLLHLVGCTIFSNKSATYVHVVHLEAFRDLGQSGGYAWGVAALVHMYDQLDEASRTTTWQIGGCWIYEHFPSVHQCVTDDVYEETSPRASRWLTAKAHMKEITGASYRASCDALTGQLRWGPMVVTIRSERVLRQFGYIQSIPLPSMTDDRWMHFSDYVVAVGELCVVPGQPDIPQVPVAFDPPRHAVDDYEGYEVITERLECVLNLRMVIVGIELHDIMQDCLRIARGVPAQMEVLGLDKDDAQSIDDLTSFFVFVTLFV
ncbi:Protein MAIN-LIKE 1 [Glycine soja]